jgi:lincosamide nucleotidyltransferase B/F
MNIADYNRFTEHLLENLKHDSRVLGVVALGSMAQQSRMPDKWSDHDFFVITIGGEQENFRQDLSWLPEAENIVLRVRETEHGLKVLYQNGHLIEFAIFDEEEISLAKVNDYRVLYDAAEITAPMTETARSSVDQPPDEKRAFSLFISLLLVGAGRHARGEVLSAHRFIKYYALMEIMPLLVKYLPAANKKPLDNLDPFRRFELVFPDAAAEINASLLQPPLTAAHKLLLIADRHLSTKLPDYPGEAVGVVRRYLENIP